jgi:formate hydrogenlyase subunit 3/multisubunit Na+/H+ antiporter MnhD subunit
MTHAGPMLVLLVPLAAVPLLWPIGRLGRVAMGWLVTVAAAASFAAVAALAPAVVAHGRLTVSVPGVLGRLGFALDGVGLVFALVATFVWTCASLYAIDYLHHDGKERRYHLTSLLTLAAMIGIVVASDLITLYVFFEWLGLAAYLFVVHVGGREADRAGLKYLILTLLGGFAVLTGALIVQGMGGGELGVGLALEPGDETMRWVAAALLVLGFGVKAGVLGLHIWLPDAHTAAPAPASALLSGLMIKAGAYGILRTVAGLFGGGPDAPPSVALQAETLALAVLYLGSATMFVGVVMALWQNVAKRLLAYSSVSQMGFILVGIGSAAYLAEGGSVGWTGTLLHVVNHALFKGLLFLGLGAVIHATGEGDLRRLGGLWRRMPWTFVFVVIAVGGIAGLPGLNGFVSKSVLHHALAYAEGHHHLVALQGAEWVFTITTIGTAAALIKLLAMTFLGSARADLGRPVHEASWRMRLAMGAMAAAIVALGVRPQLLAPVLAAGVEVYAASSAGVVRYVTSPIAYAADLRAAATALTLGALVAWASARWRVFDRPPPVWLSLDRLLAMAIAAGTVAIRWVLAERAAFEASARRLFERERDAVLAASARPPIIGRQLWLRLRVRTLAAVERLAANWELAERFTRELGQRLDESRRLDDTRRLQREARRARAEAVVVPGSEDLRRAARRRIQRDTRDLSLNVGVLFVVWLLFLGALWVVAV